MEIKRKPLQGVGNIIRFNWHFYLIALLVILILLAAKPYVSPTIQMLIYIAIGLMVFILSSSLLISFYIYDLSPLYQLKWMENANYKNILNVNAGFDETSEIIQNKFPYTHLSICCFYDPKKHTEISIKRARNAYPPKPNTLSVKTHHLPFENHRFHQTYAILSAHEIRDEKERIQFFKELNRVTTQQIFVTEHLRDRNNALAYTIGVFHFHSRNTWLKTFREAQLKVTKELKTTPFITTFVLENNGSSL